MSGFENGETAITTPAGETESITVNGVVSTITTTTTIPLTTVFTPPASCSRHWTYEAQMYNGNPGTLLLQNAIDVDQDCFPPQMYASGRAWFLQVYSPGVCPSGWETPAVMQNDGTTTAICCESNFSYLTTVSTNHWDGGTLLFHGCLSSYTSSTFVGSRSGSLVPASVSVGPGTLWGQPLTMLYQQKDLSLFSTTTTPTTTTNPAVKATGTTGSAPATGTAADASANATTATPAATSSPIPTSSPSSLSAGAAAGIAVGVVLGVLLLAAGAFFLWRSRRNRRWERGTELKGELDGREIPGSRPPVMVQTQQAPPPPPPPPQELDGASPTELYGSFAPTKTRVSGVQRSYERDAEPGELPA